MRFRKRPVLIEANRLTEENGEGLATWCGGTWHPTAKPGYNSVLSIQTPEGRMEANVGDYVIRGVAGEFYPCKEEIFFKTYEPATRRIMVCGVDCHQGDAVCNGYCTGKVDAPPPGPDAEFDEKAFVQG